MFILDIVNKISKAAKFVKNIGKTFGILGDALEVLKPLNDIWSVKEIKNAKEVIKDEKSDTKS